MALFEEQERLQNFSQMCIVTEPNIDITIKLIKRMNALFEQKIGLTFANKETVMEINGRQN